MITTHSDTNGIIKNGQIAFRSKKGNITPPLPNYHGLE